MIRVLVLIAVTGFLVSVVTLSVAIGIGGPEAVARGAWSWGHDGPWRFEHSSGFSADRDDRPGLGRVSRDMAWTGGESLSIDVPAEVTYTQVAGAPGTLRIRGSRQAVDDVEIVDGHLRFKSSRGHRRNDLDIVMSAPAVSRFTVTGSGELTIKDYRQDKLSLDLAGDAEVEVAGEAKTLDLQISGSADTDLSDLKLQDAKVDITGSGQATLAPTDSADLHISGSGEVTLLTKPAKLQSDISGSGRINQAERAMPSTADEAVRPGRT